MKIFPKSSSLGGLVEYILNRTSSHVAIYNLFKGVVLGTDKAVVSASFTPSSKYFNTEYPINESGDIRTPLDMFNGRNNPTYPVINTFDNYPKVKTIPDILNDKLGNKISIDSGLSNSITLVESPLSSVLGYSVPQTLGAVKYWPVFKLGGFWPTSTNISNSAQANISHPNRYSIIRIEVGDYSYHHVDIEYEYVSGETPLIFFILDWDNAVDGSNVEFKINFINSYSNLAHNNKAPEVVFVDGNYSDVELKDIFDSSTLDSIQGSLLSIGGMSYSYMLSDQIHPPVTINPAWSDSSYLVPTKLVVDADDRLPGNRHVLSFNGISNSFSNDNYGFDASEKVKISNNGSVLLVTSPIGDSDLTSFVDDVQINYSNNFVEMSCKNGSSAHFGKSTNKITYDLNALSPTVKLSDIIVDSSYLPYDIPNQNSLELVNIASKYDSGVFHTFDVDFSLNDSYSICIFGVQHSSISCNVRRYASSIVIDDGISINTSSTVLTKFSIFFGLKRVRDDIYKRVAVVSSTGQLIHGGRWLLCGPISEFDCAVLSNGVFSNEVIINANSSNNSVKISNILGVNDLSYSAVDDMFTNIFNGSDYDRVWDVSEYMESEELLAIRLSDVSGYLASVNCSYKSTNPVDSQGGHNALNPSTSTRIGFTFHKNKSNFNYRPLTTVSLESGSMSTIPAETRPSFYEYSAITSIGCDGVLSVKFKESSRYFISNQANNSSNLGDTRYISGSLGNSFIDIANVENLPKVTRNFKTSQMPKHSTLNSDVIPNRVDRAGISGWKVTTNYQLPLIP